MSSGWNWLLVVGGALLILVEVAFGGFAGFDLVLIGSAFLLGGGIGLLTHSPVVGLVVASALCVGYIAIGRRWVRARLKNRPVPSNANTSTEASNPNRGIRRANSASLRASRALTATPMTAPIQSSAADA